MTNQWKRTNALKSRPTHAAWNLESRGLFHTHKIFIRFADSRALSSASIQCYKRPTDFLSFKRCSLIKTQIMNFDQDPFLMALLEERMDQTKQRPKKRKWNDEPGEFENSNSEK